MVHSVTGMGVRILGIRSLIAACVVGVLAVAPGQAFANHTRGVPEQVPAGLSATFTTAHFAIHYDPSTRPPEGSAMSISEYVVAGAADFEESYSKLVAGAGGIPNAGFLGPADDGDGLVDVYLAAPLGSPNFSGGMVHPDQLGRSHLQPSSFIFMSPDMGRRSFRTGAAHEFTHVLQKAYCFVCSDPLVESFANWAAAFAVPDASPRDNNFGADQSPPPWVPLDCINQSWEGIACGGGYWQWLFVDHQVERYSTPLPGALNDTASFVLAYYEEIVRHSGGSALSLLGDTIGLLSGGTSGVRAQYAAFARDIWDRTRWSSPAIGELHDEFGPPASFTIDRSSSGETRSSTSVDHLASRYVHVVNDSGFAPSGPDDRISLTVTRPPEVSDAGAYMRHDAPGAAWSDVALPAPEGGSWTLPADPAVLKELVLPLTNDTTATDDLPFSFGVEFLPGAPMPPANDEKPGALPVSVGETASTETVYAGGRAADEAPGCELSEFDDATRGVWYRFRNGGDGDVRFDASGSDFPAVVALFTSAGRFKDCGLGSVEIESYPGADYDVFVARQAGRSGGGSRALLSVQGPPTLVPRTILYGRPKAFTKRREIRLLFKADPLNAAFECSLDGEEFADCVSPLILPGLDNGRHTVTVRASNLGVRDASPAEVKFKVDRHRPDTRIKLPQEGSHNVRLKFGSTEKRSSFTCSLDGHRFTDCKSRWRPSGLSPGNHTIRVRARDRAGNVDATPAKARFSASG